MSGWTGANWVVISTDFICQVSSNQAEPPRTGKKRRVNGFRSRSSQSGAGWSAILSQSHQSQGCHASNWAVKWVPYVAPIIPLTVCPGKRVVHLVIARLLEKALILHQIQFVSHWAVCQVILVAMTALQGVWVLSEPLSSRSKITPKIWCAGLGPVILVLLFHSVGRIGGSIAFFLLYTRRG